MTTTDRAEIIALSPVLLALEVLADRCGRLPPDDRPDFAELCQAYVAACDDEERQSALTAMREILGLCGGTIESFDDADAEPNDQLQRWSSSVGARIRSRREQAGWTQQQLADAAGLPQSHLSKLETGRHSPNMFTLEKIAAALQVAVDRLTEGS